MRILMVERVDRVLRSELGVADGLADENVWVLDPCCGTGSFSGNYNSDGTSSNNGDAGSAGNSNGNPGIGSAAFTNYTTALENKISQTTVNISAIVSALPPGIDDGSSALPIPASLAGRLLNSGGITNCKVGPAVAGFLACSC